MRLRPGRAHAPDVGRRARRSRSDGPEPVRTGRAAMTTTSPITPLIAMDRSWKAAGRVAVLLFVALVLAGAAFVGGRVSADSGHDGPRIARASSHVTAPLGPAESCRAGRAC